MWRTLNNLINPLQTLRVAWASICERARQDQKHGEQNRRNGTGLFHYKIKAEDARAAYERALSEHRLTFRHILEEEFWEVLAESDDDKLYVELIQVSAVAIAWAEAIKRRKHNKRYLEELRLE